MITTNPSGRVAGRCAAALTLAILQPAPASAEEIPFSKARLFFELNNTDGDLGVHADIDGEPWKRLEIEDPFERVILSITATGRLRRQGMTQLFFESAEPSFDELAPAEFFARFPEGAYEIAALTLDNLEMESVSTVSHVLPAPVSDLRVNGLLTPASCDEGPVPVVGAGLPVLITWNAVASSHPDLGKAGPVTIEEYEVFVERSDFKQGVQLPPSVTHHEVPVSVTQQGDQFKLEVLARATNGNRTAIETCFRVE